MDILKRALVFTLTRVLGIGLAIALIVGAFFSSMKTSNLYFILNDALKARLDEILLGNDPAEKEYFYSYDYLSTLDADETYQTLRQRYGYYEITNYGCKFDFERLLVWPWQKTKTVVVHEAVFSINGAFSSSDMTKAEAMAHDLYNVPAWPNGTYKVTLMYRDGSWLIKTVDRTGDYEYRPVETPVLSEEEIEALRTPTPEPTPERPEGETVEGRTAVISTPIAGTTVNLREGPATQYNVLKVLRAGDKLTIISKHDDWYLVRTEDQTEGYVSGFYVALT